MTQLGMVEDDEYLPEFGTLVVRDSGQPATPSGSLLDEHATDAQPSGTIARAGNGWLEGAAGDGYHRVRMEYHDRRPDRDDRDWDDVVETPYRSASGTVCLAYVTGVGVGADLALGGPGGYRVLVTRRSGVDGDDWLLRFWPEPRTPPRWFARRHPAVRPPDPGWREVLGWQADALLLIIGQAGAPTVEEVADWGRRHARPEGWLDEPVWPAPRPPLTTGHPDLDDGKRQRHRDQVAELDRNLAVLDGIAAQLGVAGPRTHRDLLDTLVAAGVLVLERERYRVVADPPRAQDVLDLPPDRVAWLNRQQAHRFASLASDIMSIVAWTGSPAETTVDGLADRLLVTREDVRGALDLAAAEGLLDVSGDLTLTVRPRRPLRSAAGAGRLAPAVLRPAPAVQASAGSDELPAGAPPRAGVIRGDGAVLVWVDGAPVVLARPNGQPPYRAIESAYGIVLLDFRSPATLVRPDGSVEPLGADLSPHGVLAPGGRFLALVEEHHGRRMRFRPLLLDLADGTRQAVPWDESLDVGVLGTHDGVLYLQCRDPVTAMRWEPGAEPQPLGYDLQQLDSVSGTGLAADRDGIVVIRKDGTRHRMAIDPAARLAPGGTRLYAYRHSPSAVTVFDVPGGAEHPRVHWLPKGCDIASMTTPWGRPVWEDSEHLVIPVGGMWALRKQVRALRLNVHTGHLETVPTPPGDGVVLVEPLLT